MPFYSLWIYSIVFLFSLFLFCLHRCFYSSFFIHSFILFFLFSFTDLSFFLFISTFLYSFFVSHIFPPSFLSFMSSPFIFLFLLSSLFILPFPLFSVSLTISYRPRSQYFSVHTIDSKQYLPAPTEIFDPAIWNFEWLNLLYAPDCMAIVTRL